ncbi:fumarylacetoacetate (FAA) hydrolase [Sphingobacterium psychroaquaticum]|uniref:Fumarylacetoacetate (FAA) hydrolase n=2 Tax=Sphingobacterium psychroaquaticum TaxID=561061 RepID=A0A1X7HYZ8_9SPHI|nr:fumarylacetoacetate (FAA) hydrolase [Sphingobacterium psychroaquaticum]
MTTFLQGGESMMQAAQQIEQEIKEGQHQAHAVPVEEATLLAPVPRPNSFRDAYAFRQHVATSRRNRGLEMIPEFDEFPVFYFSNHLAIAGPGNIDCMPKHFEQMDFELEVAVVINKQGRNIAAAEADSYIAGYMIMNDLSARKLQMEEMKLNLGPAKGKDFATAIGPWLVTKDELEPYKTTASAGHIGDAYQLEMICLVNGKEVSRGNFADMNWTFAEVIERISYGVDIYPGDLIGSGTVGTGCFLELNGTGKLNDPNYATQWLEPGDTVTMKVTGLGTLENTVHLTNN